MTLCINCGDELINNITKVQDYITLETFQILSCPQCQLLSTPPQTTASKYYPPQYYGNLGRRFPAIIEKLIERSRFHRAQIIRNLIHTPGRIIDVGCGRAIMLGQLQKFGWDVTGIEINDALIPSLSSGGINTVKSASLNPLLTPSNLNGFDLITCFHSLEHMKNPNQFINDAYSILKPGGYLIIEVPNLSSFQFMLTKLKWFHLDVPRHLYHFKLPVLSKMIIENGFIIKKVSTLSFEYGVFGFAQSIINLVSPTLNFAYRHLLKLQKNKNGDQIIDYLLLPIIFPLLIIGCIVELFASLFQKGSVIRIIAQKK